LADLYGKYHINAVKKAPIGAFFILPGKHKTLYSTYKRHYSDFYKAQIYALRKRLAINIFIVLDAPKRQRFTLYGADNEFTF
jgi:hypothetical protein